MTPEFWIGLGAGSLSLALIAGGLALLRVRGPWDLVAIMARLAGTAVLMVFLTTAAVAQGEWSPLALQQVVLGLVVALLIAHLVLAWRLQIASGGSVVDLVALILVLVAATASQPDVLLSACAQPTAQFQVQWLLYLGGSGGVLVAGCAGLTLALRRGLLWLGLNLRFTSRADLVSLLSQATFLALVALGTGLTVGVWRAWRTVGALSGGDPREVWMAATWLLAAMSLSAWQLEGQRGRWAAGLAVAAAATVLVGLLAVTNQQPFMGM